MQLYNYMLNNHWWIPCCRDLTIEARHFKQVGLIEGYPMGKDWGITSTELK